MWRLISLILCLALIGAVPAGQTGGVKVKFGPYKHPITIWIPPYAVGKCRDQLAARPEIGKALTHLAMQFWVPTVSGGVELVKKNEAGDAVVAEMRDWAHARGIRAMLCVYNAGSGKWDWPLARGAFAEHRAAFVKSLVAEMERHHLDGIDIDLEGDGNLEADREPFVAFITSLSKELHARNKHLTVDVFPHKWNAPNQTWWAELFPHVDALASMGYEHIGSTATEWRAYAAQRQAAGKHARKLQIGVPSSNDSWQNNTAMEQLKWVRKDGTMGIAIWDAQLRAAAWKTPEIWQFIAGIRMGLRLK